MSKKCYSMDIKENITIDTLKLSTTILRRQKQVNSTVSISDTPKFTKKLGFP